MRPQAPARQIRIRKLAKHTQQPVLREDQFESTEYCSLQNQYVVETGVEKSEEKEYHLQAALAATSGASDKDAEKEIPAPPAQESSNIDYDGLYSLTFEKPATYIRFSQTVEDCTGSQYNMTTEDDIFLTAYNQDKSVKCSEDDFEKIMEIFEESSEIQAPHGFVDGFVVSFENMNVSLQQQVDGRISIFAKDVYEHWKIRKHENGNYPLQPTLKFERNQEKDDGDPYVCFRRRDARQTRKTRARDLQSTDKLRKLRKELEDGRNLIEMAYRRELLKRDLLDVESGVFEKRLKVKEAKVQLGVKGDDQDLVNERVCFNFPLNKSMANAHKPMRRRDQSALRNPSGPTQLRLGRSEGRPVEADLIQLSDEQEKKVNRLRAEIEEKAKLHRSWNQSHVDLTREPLSPLPGQGSEAGFRTVTAQYQLMTPPSSVILEPFDRGSPSREDEDKNESFNFNVSSPLGADEEHWHPAYRRRIGRGGRLWIDRRGISSPVITTNPVILDRWKYDREDDDEQLIYDMDPYSTSSMKFRATIPFPTYLFSQRARLEDRKSTHGKSAGVNQAQNRTNTESLPKITQPQAK